MKVLLLNGPPRCGKDTIAEFIKNWNRSEVMIEKFARPMKIACPLIYSIPRELWDNTLDTAEKKDTPSELLFGRTPREVQIAMSEEYLKKLHDNEIFGKLALNRMRNVSFGLNQFFIISDCGFLEEAQVIINAIGAANVQLWRISRPGCDFSKDSRNWIYPEVETIEIDNSKGRVSLHDLVLALFQSFITVKGPKETDEEFLQARLEERENAFAIWRESDD